jgi:calcineurin-like phosphoesterase family protein
MKIWLTADYHLGDSRLKILGRPFSSSQEFIDELMYLHNSVVNKEDEVIIVGDVCYQMAPQFLEMIDGFNGIKTLIRGNHDRGLSDKDLKPYFKKIIPEGDGIEIDVEGLPCYVTHYPTEGRKDRFNLVGHVHSPWKYQLNMFNVGIDVNHFLPVDLSTIPFHFKAICEYYDEDVWSAYKNLNKDYVGKRGKNGTYFRDREK